MQLKHDTIASLPEFPTKPQIHSHKHHNAYNGSRHLPISIRVKRSPAPHLQSANDDGCTQHHYRPHHGRHVFAVTLFYERNRACTIYRSREDFTQLERAAPQARGLITLRPNGRADAHYLQRLLLEAIAKRPNECAVEYFLRRRMGDCGC
ncbi:hypothetical protein OQA88_3800 [Cercophora sp. LCS_1]